MDRAARQGMAEKFLNKMPFASQMTNRLGHLTGLPHAERLLSDERMLMVFPEGSRGTASYTRSATRRRLRTGFVRLAMKMKTPTHLRSRSSAVARRCRRSRTRTRSAS